VARIGPNDRNAWQASADHVDLVRTPRTPVPVRLAAEPQSLTVDLASCACVVVDMQNDFCAPGGWLASIGVDVAPARRPVGPLSALLPELRSAGIPVIWLNWGNRPDRANLPPGVLHVYDRDGASTGIGDPLPGSGSHVLEAGSWSAALVDGLEAGPGDLFVDKYRMSGFFDTELDSILRNLDVTTLLFAGVNVDQCVLATLADAACLGYDVVLLDDCSATTSPPFCHDATRYNVRQCFGFVSSGRALLEGLGVTTAGFEARSEDPPPGTDVGPQRFDVAGAVARHISRGDTVKLALLRAPDRLYDASVFLEIWEPGGAQPPNSHPRSVETFLFLRGSGRAYCDQTVVEVAAGQLLVLPPRSVHRIEAGPDEKLYAITTMVPDEGFAALVLAGEAAPLDDDERAVLAQAAGSARVAAP
jgi:nicotinamidase-related amidase/mannose-6-phosphate isomerase-like protein (cupin superfamily)